MLDAAHGTCDSPIAISQRTDIAGEEVEHAGVVVPGVVGRRRPRIADRADIVQGSRRVVAVARSAR